MANRNIQKNGIRKAAVFVSSLERSAADLVLEQMAPPQARAVRQAMVDLGAIDAEEQRRVIEEFRRLGPLVPSRHPPGIELDDSLAQKLAAPAGDLPEEPEETHPTG